MNYLSMCFSHSKFYFHFKLKRLKSNTSDKYNLYKHHLNFFCWKYLPHSVIGESMNNEYTYQIPSYALSYIYNGDDSGLEQDDIDNIDAFLAREHYIDTWDILDESEYFCTTPEFGLPCSVVDVVGVQFANS